MVFNLVHGEQPFASVYPYLYVHRIEKFDANVIILRKMQKVKYVL